MPRILLTSGPTRQHLDPVRFLTNASSGRMGAALTQAIVDAGFEVTVVSGPVEVRYPPQAEVVPVISTEEMLAACQAAFPRCDGLIAVAAPCDYRPRQVESQKIAKTGQPLVLELVETPDIVASLAALRTRQWIVAFALETEDAADMIVLATKRLAPRYDQEKMRAVLSNLAFAKRVESAVKKQVETLYSQDIVVTADEEGVVVLRGLAADMRSKALAGEAAAKVQGVTRVVNNLTTTQYSV